VTRAEPGGRAAQLRRALLVWATQLTVPAHRPCDQHGAHVDKEGAAVLDAVEDYKETGGSSNECQCRQKVSLSLCVWRKT
jgi:hypothetical protein